MEATFIGIVLTSVGQFAVMYIVLAATISFDYADNNEQKDKEGKGKDHSNEPSSCNDAVIVLWNNNNI